MTQPAEYAQRAGDRYVMLPSMRSLTWIVAALVVVVGLATFLLVSNPALPLAVVALPLDVVVNDTALLVGIGVVWLSYLRYRESGSVAFGAITAAFLVSAGWNLVVITLQASEADAAVGMALSALTQEPLYLHGIIRFVAATTLVVGGIGLVRDWRSRAWWWLPVPLVVAVGGSALVHVWWERLPAWLTPESLAAVAAGNANRTLAGVSAAAIALQTMTALLFLAAGFLYSRHPHRTSPLASYLAAALVLGAAAEIHYALFPGGFTGVVGSNDVLRLLFATILLVGMAADLRASSRALVVAEQEVARLREADLARAALQERARLAREIHDGLSQHLWLAKLRTEQLLPTLGTDAARGTLGEIATLIDTSLEEAQATVSALREQPGEPLANAVSRHVEAFERQRGIRVDLELGELPQVPPRVGSEILRVVQEAMSNAARHADATRIGVRLAAVDGVLEVEVRDNGIGFDPTQASSGFGLTSMRERVESLGGQFLVVSAPSEGSTVHAEVPLDG